MIDTMKLYRYEIIVKGNKSLEEVFKEDKKGLLTGMNHLCSMDYFNDHTNEVESLMKEFNNLPDPAKEEPIISLFFLNRITESWFTELGLKKFKNVLDRIIEVCNHFKIDISISVKNYEIDENTFYYDDYQVIFELDSFLK